jgi:hypothetical protein
MLWDGFMAGWDGVYIWLMQRSVLNERAFSLPMRWIRIID